MKKATSVGDDSADLTANVADFGSQKELVSSSLRIFWNRKAVPLSELLASEHPQLWVVESVVYEAYALQFPKDKLLVLPGGEAQKQWTSVQKLLLTFLERGLQRGLPLVAVGGGAQLDLVAFAAAIYQRGLPLIVVPTTLLAVVDAAVGGKNGINFAGYKNLVGTVRQPDRLILDTRFLEQIPEDAWAEGFAEVIKYACIADSDLFLELSSADLTHYQGDREVLQSLISRCLEHKLRLVAGDEEDQYGQRILLNFGHSLAHALELQQSCSHGKAVACGIAFASWLSVERGLLTAGSYEKICAILPRYGLPTYMTFEPSEALEAMRRDKKRKAAQLQFICLREIGKPLLQMLSFSELSFYLKRYQACAR